MTEHKYTDEEVIKALEYHSDPAKTCVSECAYGYQRYCGSKMAKDALDLINRQKAEISALTSAVDNSTQEFLELHDKYQEQKAEIERYEKENGEKFNKWLLLDERTKERYAELYEEAKGVVRVEAIKEFAEKLKKRECSNAFCAWCAHADIYGHRAKECDEPYVDKDGKEQKACYAYAKFESYIDALVKEFTEEKT